MDSSSSSCKEFRDGLGEDEVARLDATSSNTLVGEFVCSSSFDPRAAALDKDAPPPPPTTRDEKELPRLSLDDKDKVKDESDPEKDRETVSGPRRITVGGARTLAKQLLLADIGASYFGNFPSVDHRLLFLSCLVR